MKNWRKLQALQLKGTGRPRACEGRHEDSVLFGWGGTGG